MKILESKVLPSGNAASVRFIRIDPEDLTETLSDILKTIMDLSWLKDFDKEFLAQSFEECAKITISDIKSKFDAFDGSKLTKDAGEYVVSELAREAMVNELKYLDIPLAELIGKKVSGNPGFDFHSQNPSTDTVIFGEAKFVANRSAYAKAVNQIYEFVEEKKDIKDIKDLEHFCTDNALRRASNGSKGFAAAFSAKSTSSDRIIASITTMNNYKKLLKHEEIILVAVNL